MRLTWNEFLSFLKHLIFIAIFVTACIGLVLLDIYIEAGGAKLIFKNMNWQKEIVAVFLSLGIPPQYLSPSTLFGIIITSISVGSAFYIIYKLLGIIGSLQGYIVNRAKESLMNILKVSIYTLFICIMYFYIALNWSVPFAQYQLAHYFWSQDFKPTIEGDSIQIRYKTPDLNDILKKHEGEFSYGVVTRFFYAFIVFHFLIAFLTEMSFLYAGGTINKLQQSHDETIHNLRVGMKSIFRRNDSSQANDNENRQTEEQANNDGHALNNGAETDTETRTEKVDDIKSEEQPLRVIGGNETISPVEAEKMPDLYTIVTERDSEAGNVLYRIYTNDFYNNLQKREGDL